MFLLPTSLDDPVIPDFTPALAIPSPIILSVPLPAPFNRNLLSSGSGSQSDDVAGSGTVLSLPLAHGTDVHIEPPDFDMYIFLIPKASLPVGGGGGGGSGPGGGGITTTVAGYISLHDNHLNATLVKPESHLNSVAGPPHRIIWS